MLNVEYISHLLQINKPYLPSETMQVLLFLQRWSINIYGTASNVCLIIFKTHNKYNSSSKY